MAVLQIPISKGKELFVEFDTDELVSDDFPAEVYKEIIFQGLKEILNRNMSKEQTSKKIEDEAKLAENQARLLTKAESNLEAMRKSEIRIAGGAKKAKISGVVKTEAMRLARALVKDAIKREGKVKVSHVAAKDITALAKELMDGEYGPDIIKQAEETIATRAKEEEKVVSGKAIDLGKVKADPKLVADANKKKAEAKAATEAKGRKGKAPPPAKPRAAQHAGH